MATMKDQVGWIYNRAHGAPKDTMRVEVKGQRKDFPDSEKGSVEAAAFITEVAGDTWHLIPTPMGYAILEGHKPQPLTSADLDKIACDTPDCAEDEEMYFSSACHTEAGCLTYYNRKTKTLVVECSVCKKKVMEVAVAEGLRSSGSVN